MIRILSIGAASAVLLLGACSGPEEDAAHKQANSIEKSGEQQADALENAADKAPTEAQKDTLNQQADAVEKSTEMQADNIRKETDKAH